MDAYRDERLSANFTRAEFACKGADCCGGAAPVDPRLVTMLQRIRMVTGRAVVVSSGFRCPSHNMAVGGVLGSYHTLAQAADIHCPGMPSAQLFQIVFSVIPSIGYGHAIHYPAKNFVHIDIHTRRP